MIDWMLTAMIVLFTMWISACIIRLIIGPSTADRIVSLNILSGLVLGLLVLVGAQKRSSLFLDVALVYDIFGFLGFLAIAKILDKHLRAFVGKEDESK